MGLSPGLNERFELLEQLPGILLIECFHVRDRADGKECLLKVLPSALGNNGTVQASFRDFFMKYGQIPGRRVPQRLDFRASKGIFYVLEEFSAGTRISAMDRSTSSINDVVRIVEEACEALNLAHLKGVYHLCLRPEDICMTGDSSVKLAGFGAAVFLNTGHLSRLDDRSRRFCAPEITGGSASPASDVYSLAAVIANCFPVVSKHEVIVQALSSDPEQRFPNILSFQAELRDVFISQAPPPPPEKSRKPGTVIEKLIVHIRPSGTEIAVRENTDLKWHKSPDKLEILGEPEQWDRGVTIELRKADYQSKTLKISGPPEVDEYTVSLNPTQRLIIIKTRPPGAHVRTADRDLGFTEAEAGLQVKWAKDLKLFIEKEGYESVTYQLPANPPPDLAEQVIKLSRREVSLRIIDQILARVRDAQITLGQPELSAFRLPPAQEAFTEWIEDLEKQRFLSTQRFSVMLLGEYNSGKSSLLNALLELPSKKQLPVFDKPATAKPIRLTYRNPGDPEAAWIMSDMSEEPKDWDEALGQASTKADNLRDEIREIKLYLDHPLLRQADIMDMPGTGAGWFEEHADITRDYLVTAELVIFVIGRTVPGKEVVKDLNAVRQLEIPLAVVFNAWGCLDLERNRKISVDQNSHESCIRALFPWAFTDRPASRVYSQKCLDARQEGLQIHDEWGLTEFRHRFQEACLGEFLERSGARREKIRKRVIQEALDSADSLKECLEVWRRELIDSGKDGRDAERFRRRMDATERTIRRRVGAIADDKSKEILEHFFQTGIVFIRDNFKLDAKLITALIKRSFGQNGRRTLSDELNDRLTKDYLEVDKEDNWLQQSIRDYLQECLPIVQEEWERLVVKIDLGISTRQSFDSRPRLSADALTRAVIDGTHAIIESLFSAGAVLGILLLIPGKIILDIVIALGVLIWHGNPMEKMRQRAIERLRIEIDQQHSAFRQELVAFVMNGTNSEFRRAVESQRGTTQDRKTALLQHGITCLQELQQFLEDVGCESN